MKKFEVGKRYYESGLTYEITKKAAKTIWFKTIQHAGRFNETIMAEGRAKLLNWPNGEVFVDGRRTVEA